MRSSTSIFIKGAMDSPHRRFTGSVASAAMNFAAVGSSRNFGSGSSILGRSVPKIGFADRDVGIIPLDETFVLPYSWGVVAGDVGDEMCR